MEHLDLLLHSYIDLFRVSIAYFILVFLLPSFMVKPIVKDRNLYERIMIYIIVGNFYLMILTFVLAYIGIFTRVVLIISIILSAITIRIMLTPKKERVALKTFLRSIQDVFSGKQGFNLYIQETLSKIKIKRNKLYKTLISNKKIELIIFICICIFNIYILNYANYTTVSYIFPDVEVHLYWIQSLIDGNIFPSGAYPHLMHNVFATVITIFNFDAIIFFKEIGVFISTVIFTMLYVGLRLTFKSKYAVLFAFFIYCVVNVYADGVGMRFQAALPQEYGMLLLIPMVVFLYRYIKRKKIFDLLLFGTALSLIISAHFYTAIVALLYCIAYGIVYIKKILKNKLLFRLIVCGILSLVVAVIPLAVGVGIGKGIEQSMDWAVGVINGIDIYDNSTSVVDTNATQPFDLQVYSDKVIWSLSSDLFRYKLISYIYILLLAVSTVFLTIFSIIKKFKQKYTRLLPHVLLLIFLTFMASFEHLNIPEIILSNRVYYYVAYFSPFLLVVPLEVAYNLSNNGFYKKLCSYTMLFLIPALTVYIISTNSYKIFHGFIYFQAKGAMITDISIIENYEDYTWTVVSPINDMSIIMNNGYHYELSDFIYNQENWVESTELIIPTKYVFIYIEKIPRIINGMFEYDNYEELKDRINSQITISYEQASYMLETTKPPKDVYTTYRRTLMSKAYYWAKEYIKYFPEEMIVYYEDEEIVIYKITQNEYALNNLAIDYGLNSTTIEQE